jgi:hypothetical protein
MSDSITIQSDDSLPPVPDLQGNQEDLEALARRPSPFLFVFGFVCFSVLVLSFVELAFFF